ncbi:MAG TPA: Rieske 2Fe-2S domain-containing protein [Thermoplasmata archaeon]|nr:Rieske 2Fe-2S domain-containing protein [Thermoplasmata archaeon]
MAAAAGPIHLAGVKPPAEGAAIRVVAAGTPVAVFNVGGTLYAIGAVCTHVGGPLEQGHVASGVVSCPWHGSKFELANGHVVGGPAQRPVAAFRVRAEGDGLVLERA